MRIVSAIVITILFATLAPVASAAAPAELPRYVPDPGRVAEIAAMLPDKPVGVGRPITDRAAWDKLAAGEFFKGVIKLADAYVKEPIPDQPDELFLMYTKNGDRSAWQKVAFERRSRFSRLVLAECAQNQGRYLDKIRQYVEALCAETTWVYSAHDGKLENFRGKFIDIDLGSSALCWQMATASWLLGDKLDPATRKLIRENLDRRSNQPFLDSLVGKHRQFFWATATHNWNAVCTAGTVGVALASLEDKTQRAQFIAAAEKSNEFFLSGFTDDGYCSEGLGYWNYGFGHFVLLAETVKQATGGKLDFLAHPRAKAPATFAARIQIINGVAPAFADCPVYPKPGPQTMWYLNRRFDLGLPQYDKLDVLSSRSSIFEEMLFRCENTMSAINPAAGPGAEGSGGGDAVVLKLSRQDDRADSTPRVIVSIPGKPEQELPIRIDQGDGKAAQPLRELLTGLQKSRRDAFKVTVSAARDVRYAQVQLVLQECAAAGVTNVNFSSARTPAEIRTWFDKAGILISRPAAGASTIMGVALKGGHNAEHHNHNDVGSYVVVVGDACVLLDPGPETYTRRTFSGQRYDSKLLNSFGHAVPVVAGQLQKPGRQSQAVITKTDFTDAADTLGMDITSCYGVKELKKLERTFVYSRAGAGSLTITDRVQFSTPQTFGTALITLGTCKPQPDGSLVIEDGNQALVVTIDAGGAKWNIKTEPIIEQAPVKPTRIGIDLAETTAEAQVTLKIVPRGK